MMMKPKATTSNKAIRNVVQLRMDELGYTRMDLARAANTTHQTISNFLLGRNPIGSNKLELILDFLKLEICLK